MSLVDDVLGGWTGGIAVGLGAAVLVPAIVPFATAVVHPVAKTVVWGGVVVGDTVSGIVSAVSAQVSGIVGEGRKPETRRPRPAPAPL